jgi:uncharacterized phage protein gp47/JayE
VTSAPFLERLSGLLGDLSTRLGLAGLASCLALSVGLLRWVSRHYVSGTATGRRLTNWEKAMEGERTGGRTRDEAYEADRASRAQLSGTMRGSNGGRGDGRHARPG